MGREVGGGIGMGKTCEPKAFSFQCMTKFTTKKNNNNNKCGLLQGKKKRGLDLIKMNFLYPLLISDILERDQEVPMPHRSRNEEMSLEKFEFV